MSYLKGGEGPHPLGMFHAYSIRLKSNNPIQLIIKQPNSCNEQASFYQASAVLIQICADQYYLCLIFGDALSLAKRQSIAEDQASVVLIRTNLNQYRRRSVE